MVGQPLGAGGGGEADIHKGQVGQEEVQGGGGCSLGSAAMARMMGRLPGL